MALTMKKKIFLGSFAVVILAVGGFVFLGKSSDSKKDALPKLKVQKGNIVVKALAVGTIEPENEISVKSKVSGVVKHIFAEVGTYVKAGQLLLEVKPDPTPLELADAKRQVQLAEVELVNMTKERVRQESLVKKQMIAAKEFEDFERNFQQA